MYLKFSFLHYCDQGQTEYVYSGLQRHLISTLKPSFGSVALTLTTEVPRACLFEGWPLYTIWLNWVVGDFCSCIASRWSSPSKAIRTKWLELCFSGSSGFSNTRSSSLFLLVVSFTLKTNRELQLSWSFYKGIASNMRIFCRFYGKSCSRMSQLSNTPAEPWALLFTSWIFVLMWKTFKGFSTTVSKVWYKL